ncbi:MAG: pitrilysin family protein [Anaerolineales bacterium]|jgi:zinc protease
MKDSYMAFSPALHSLPGPDDIKRVELSNGIVVLARPNFNSPSVIISGFLKSGSLFEPDDKLGLAGFTASALMRGTQERDFQSIYESLESVGAGLGFSGGAHTTSFSGRALAEDLDMLFALLAQALRKPVFPGDQIERLRAQILTGLAIRSQDTGEMASLAFDELVYAGHPYGRPEDGNTETIRGISRQDLLDFHHRHYGPTGMVVVVVGGVDPDEAIGRVERALGDWANPDQPAPPALPPVRLLEETLTRNTLIAGKSQSDLVIGAPGPPRRSPDYLAASVGNNILGQFGMFGRIGQVVREQAGLAYYAYSTLGGGLGPGAWYISAGVDPDNVSRAVDLISQEIGHFVSEPVESEELEDTKTHYIGRLPLSLESNAGVAGALLNLERYDLGLDYYRRYADMISSITKDEILAAARTYLDPLRLGISIAGP